MRLEISLLTWKQASFEINNNNVSKLILFQSYVSKFTFVTRNSLNDVLEDFSDVRGYIMSDLCPINVR